MSLEAFWLNNPQEYYLYTDEYIFKEKQKAEDMDIMLWRNNMYSVYATKQALSKGTTGVFPSKPFGIEEEHHRPRTQAELKAKVMSGISKHNEIIRQRNEMLAKRGLTNG